jgi:Uma2 family endonuclease
MSTPTQTDPPRPPRQTLPTMYDLPSEEIGDPGMPDQYNVRPLILLHETFRPPAVPTDEVFSAIELNLYYDESHPRWYVQPDWFGVIGAPQIPFRWRYAIWEEQAAPLIVVEMFSPRLEEELLGSPDRDPTKPPTKWEIYEQILRIPYYVVFDGEREGLRIFRLNGARYQEITGHGGRFPVAEAGLWLGLWQGSFYRSERLWLRWYDAEGNLIPTVEEQAERARLEAEVGRREAAYARNLEQLRQRAEQAEQMLERERQRAERLAGLLRQMGQDPDKL